MTVEFTLTAHCDNGKVCSFTKPIEVDLSDQACWTRIDAPGAAALGIVGKECQVKSVNLHVRAL